MVAAVISVEDLENALPGLAFDESTQPSVGQVQGYIADVVGEVTAHLQGLGATWPDDGTPAATFVRTTAIDGALARTLSAMYALSANSTEPGSVARLQSTYQSDLRGLERIVRGLQQQNPAKQGRSTPRVSLAPLAARLGGSFEQYTDARTYEEWRETAFVPWWRRFFVPQ